MTERIEPILEDAPAAAAALELRVLHGPQAGSSLPLEQGAEYTLGSGEDCEVFLAGAGVEARHAVLDTSAGGLRIVPLEGRVIVAGRELPQAQDLPYDAVVQLGKVKICASLAGTPWPGEEEFERMLEEEAAAAHAPQPDPQSAPAEPGAAGDAGIAAAATAAPPPAPPSRPRLTRAAPLLGALAMVGCVGCAILIVLQEVRAGEAAAAPMEGVVAPVVAPASAPETMPPAAAPEPRSPAARLADVRTALEKLRQPGSLELRAEAGDGAAIRIRGAAQSQEGAASALATVRAAVADAEPLEPAFLTRAQLREKFLAELRSQGLLQKLSQAEVPDELQLDGALAPADRARFEALFLDFTAAHGTVLNVRARIRDQTADAASGVAAVVGGAFPVVITTSGQRVAPGGMLGGRVIISIRDGEVAFADGVRLRFN